jgi:NAD(P)-dependent dehydrogenase (short-subunit alcohol dehydrogenase family)
MSETVLTTGANSGIGLATVIELARRGFHSVGSVRSEEKARHVGAEAEKAGARADTVLLDVNDAEACKRVMDELQPFGIVNNAGMQITGAVEEISDDEARQALETMVIAPTRLARLAIPHMRIAGRGRIVNVSSIYGVATTPLTGWYQAAKHALEAVSDALRMEVAGAGIHVALVEPGGFDTDIWEDATEDLGNRDDSPYQTAYQRTLTGIKLSRRFMGDPGKVAKVIGQAMTSRLPRPRYLVGYDAKAMAAMERVVPTMLRDRITRIALGL